MLCLCVCMCERDCILCAYNIFSFSFWRQFFSVISNENQIKPQTRKSYNSKRNMLLLSNQKRFRFPIKIGNNNRKIKRLSESKGGTKKEREGLVYQINTTTTRSNEVVIVSDLLLFALIINSWKQK